MEKRIKMSKNEGFENRSPLQRLNGIQIRKPNTSNLGSFSSSSSSVSLEATKFSSRFLHTSNSSSAAPSSSSSSSYSKTHLHRKPRNLNRQNEVPKKHFSQKPMKTQPPRLDKKQFGKAKSKPTIKIGQRSKLCPAQRNPVKILKKGSGKLEEKSKNCAENGSGELTTNLSRVSNGVNLDCVDNCTPEGKLASLCGLDSVSFDYCEKVDEGSILKAGNGKNSDTTAVKTPPVEASVSPEIQFGSHSKLQILKSTATCYRAGHLLSGVTDKRKCRRRGSLKGGCGKLNLSDDEKKVENVIPLPAEASVRWVLSPCDEELEDLESKLEKCKLIGENDLFSSPLEHDVVENNFALSLGSLTSGNIIQTPSSGSSPYGCAGRSNVDFVNFELDSVTKSLSEVGPLISGISLQCEDMTQVQENANSVCSWVSDCTLENLTLSQTRISWRDVLVSRIDENDDEFDCCRCLSDEEVDADVGCEPGGDRENKSDSNARRNEKLSPRKLNASAESICTNGGDLVASGDSDWMCFRENHFLHYTTALPEWSPIRRRPPATQAMENHHVVAETDVNNGSMSIDCISQLPQPILHRILSFLSHKNAAKTCILSKSWRYLWYARPNLEFHQRDFLGDTKTFMFVLDTTLQRCHDQKLSIQDFFLELSGVVDPKLTQLLEKWVSIVLQNMRVKTFRLHIPRQQVCAYFDMPPIVFQSESLRELHLRGCNLYRIDSVNNILLKNLQTLSLIRVHISKSTLENLFSSCPLLENMSVLRCKGFEMISMSSSSNNNKPHGLKHLAIEDFKALYYYAQERHTISIEIDISTIETIRTTACLFHHHNNYFPNLKSLTLERVRLSNKSFNFFSHIYMPRLECLILDSCYGFKDIKMLLSDSVKHVTFRNPRDHTFTNAVIDAPDILTFAYEGKIDLRSGLVSFVTNSIEWESNINVSFFSYYNNNPSSWFGKVSEQLGALSGSRISLELYHLDRDLRRRDALYERVPEIIFCERDYEPVVVEHLSLRVRYTHASLAAFLYCLFRICRPRYVGQDLFSNAESDEERDDKELTLLLFVILVMEREMREQFWPGGLEDVKMESFDEDDGQGSGAKFRFRLKWRDQ